MYNVSPTYRTKITETTRSTRLRGQIVLGAVTIPLAGEDILAGSVDWKNQCIDKDDFNLGSVFAATLKFSIYDRVTALDLKGATVTLEFGLQLSDILIEYVPLGVFNVIDAGHKLSTIVITAMDNMIRLDKDIPAPLTGTPDALLAAMATATGVDIENTTVASFPNGTDVITITPGDSLITWRDMLMWLSQYLGAFATMSRTGKAWIKELVSTPVMTIAPAIRFKSPLIKDEPVTITGLKATFSSTLYDFNLAITPNTGKTYTLDDNPLFWDYDDTQSGYRLENILTTLGTVNYMQGDVEYNGNPALDVGDYVLLTGTSKGDVVLRITSFSWKSKGKCTIRSAGLSSILKAKEDLTYRKGKASAQIQIDKLSGVIELKVSKDEIVSLINVSPEIIKIISDKIALEGLTTVNEFFKVLLDGSIEAVNGKFTGMIIATGGKIGRLDITDLDGDIYYLSDLFAKQYDNNDVTRLRQILAGLITQTDYDLFVYDINNTGTLTTTDLVNVRRIVEGLDPNPNKMVRSEIIIGKTTGEMSVTSISSTGHYSPSSFKMWGDRLIGDMAKIKSIDTQNLMFGVLGTADSNTLSDWRQGPFTPIFYSVGASFTYAQNRGWYTKKGNEVTAHIYIQVSGKSGTLTNSVFISQLPFISKGGDSLGCSAAIGYHQFLIEPSMYVDPSSDGLNIVQRGTTTTMKASQVANGYYMLTITYIAA